MRILVLGANGRSGSSVVAQAIARGHTVTALVRRPETLPPQASLTIIAGTPLSQSDISQAFESAPASDPIKAVISTLNTTRTSDNPWAKSASPDNLMTDSARNALTVMRRYDVKKIVALGAVGVGKTKQNSGRISIFIHDHSNLKRTFDDHAAVQKLFEEEGKKDAGLQWVDVFAALFKEGGKKPIKEFPSNAEGAGWFITRESVAAFMLDAVEQDRWDRQSPVISN